MARRSTKNLTEGNIYKNFSLFALPLILSSVLSQTFGVVDMIIAGRFLGDVALGATSAVSSLFSLYNSAFWGFMTGVGVYIAQIFGAGDYAKLKQVYYSTVLALVGVLSLSSGLLIALREPLFRFMKVAPELYDDTMTYFVINMSFKVLTCLGWLGSYTMNAMGNTAYPFGLSIFSAVFNLIGNIVTVTVFHWGIAGLAVSTVCSAGLVSIVYFFKIHRCLRELGVARVKFRFSGHHIVTTFRFSLPNMIQQMAMFLALFLQSPLINGLGKAATVSYALCSRLIDLINGVYGQGARTMTTYIAQCMGACKIDRIRRGIRLGFLQGLVLFAVPFLLCFFAARQIFGLFFPAGYSGEALDIALFFVHSFMWTLIFTMFDNLFHGIFRGVGAMYWLVVSTVIGSALRIGAGYILVPHMGMSGIFTAWAIASSGEALFALAIYLLRYRNETLIRRHCLTPKPDKA